MPQVAASLALLPDLCLYAILKYLPAGDSIRIGLVCRRLYNIQRIAFIRLAKRTRSIRINDLGQHGLMMPISEADFFGINEANNIVVNIKNNAIDNSIQQNYDLVVKSELVTRLSTFFRKIKRLTVVVNNYHLNCNIATLLSLWPKLVELTVIGIEKFSDLEQLSHSINKLKRLKRLTLDVPLYKLSINLEIFTKLEHFICRLTTENATWSELRMLNYLFYVVDLVNGFPNIGSFGLWCDFDVTHAGYHNWPEVAVQRITRLGNLQFECQPFISNFTVICSMFSSLTHIQVSLDRNHSLLDAITCLASLNHLSILNISPFYLEELENVNSLPRLESIKKVRINSHFDPHKLSLLDAIFPNANRMSFDLCYEHQWKATASKLCYECNVHNVPFRFNACVNCCTIWNYFPFELPNEYLMVKKVRFHLKKGLIERSHLL